MQSLETCWMLCSACHRLKSKNEPSAARWLKTFMSWAKAKAEREEADGKTNAAYDYREAAAMASIRLKSLQLQGRA